MIKIKNGEFKKQVLEVLGREKRYVSVNYIANNVGKHWTHVYAVFLVLEKEGIIKTLKTQNGFFAILNPKPEQPSNCGGCQYFDGDHYCKLLGNYNLYRDRFTKSCPQALPKNIGGEKIVR